METNITPPSAHLAPVKVSVVVPTYNTGETILTGLRSLLSQTMPQSDFEIVYVDDGSTDDTVRLLEDEVAAQGAGSTVRILRIENSGWPGRPRNVGTDAARGAYVFYVDDDDWVGPEALERMYARARATDADIVLGRMAGHGRRAPMAVFDKPIAASDVRTDATLLGAMTVHKFFRRAFLREHGLRFAEGVVRLEDHMFTLRAYLLTSRIATVHDYTCYHWVRHRNGQHNHSYGVEPGQQIDSVRRVLAILEAPDTRVEDDDRRHRMAARWYGDKALHRLTGDRFLRQPEPRRAAWFDAVSSLAREMPPEADAALPARLRMTAALARLGDRRLLEEHAEFEAGLTHGPRVIAADWHDGRLTVRCRTRLVRKPGKTGATPVTFVRSRGRHLLQPTPGVAASTDITRAADFTKAVQRSTVRVLLHHREGGTELRLPTECRLVAEPVRHGSIVRRLTAAVARGVRRTARPAAGRRDTDPQPRALCYESEFTIDPASADRGKPLAKGTWDLKLRLDCGGWRLVRKLPDLSVDVPAPPDATGG